MNRLLKYYFLKTKKSSAASFPSLPNPLSQLPKSHSPSQTATTKARTSSRSLPRRCHHVFWFTVVLRWLIIRPPCFTSTSTVHPTPVNRTSPFQGLLLPTTITMIDNYRVMRHLKVMRFIRSSILMTLIQPRFLKKLNESIVMSERTQRNFASCWSGFDCNIWIIGMNLVILYTSLSGEYWLLFSYTIMISTILNLKYFTFSSWEMNGKIRGVWNQEENNNEKKPWLFTVVAWHGQWVLLWRENGFGKETT